MKKIYIRAGVLPYETVTPQDCLTKNVVGGNVGNLVYQYSIINTLATQNTEFEASRYQVKLEDAERINQECDAFVIPLADAFRPSFMKELRQLTSFIEKLTIPCVVVGAGLRSSYEPDFSSLAPLDEDVKNFVCAVLKKSAKLGLRGEITGAYLKKLGFQEEKDFTVIGCPSIYLNEKELSVREVNLNSESKISLSSCMYPNPEFSDFLRNVQKEYPNYRFVGQIRNELRLLYTGCPFPAGEAYPCKEPESPAYGSGKARYFINVPSWLNHMREMDLSIGTRFHGNMTGTLVGTPSILLASDARTRELADYHKLPSIPMHELKMGMSLLELVKRVDFKKMETVHENNFKHYLSFLEENGLDHIYKHDQKINFLQKRLKGVDLNQGVKPWLGILEQEYRERVGLSYDWLISEYYKNKYGI